MKTLPTKLSPALRLSVAWTDEEGTRFGLGMVVLTPAIVVERVTDWAD